MKNEDFKDEFIEEALDYENRLEQEILDDYISCSYLVAMTANYLLAREDNQAWQKFDHYVNLIQFTEDQAQAIKDIINGRMIKGSY